MKKAAFTIATLFALISLYLAYNAVFYADKAPFIPPLTGERLIIRNDSWGEGHFGAKRKNGRTHKGVDLSAGLGTPVVAAKSGWAVSRFDEDGYGNYVKVFHSGGLMTIYGHMEGTTMRLAKRVRQGDIVGWVGNTGNARARGIGYHVHFEVRKNGVAVDPMKGYLR